MKGPLIDLTDPAVGRMLKLAKARGFVTRDELNEVLPPAEFSAEQIQEAVRELTARGIPVVEPGDPPGNSRS